MKLAQKLVSVLLVIVFLVLVYLFFKTYQDTRYANTYIEFVTNSANEVIAEVDTANTELNAIEYTPEQDTVNDLQSRLSAVETVLNRIENERNDYEVPYKGEDVQTAFSEFRSKGEDVRSALSEVVNSIENLDEREVFEQKVEQYIIASNQLQDSSVALEGKLNEYVDNYNKIDLERILHAVTSL